MGKDQKFTDEQIDQLKIRLMLATLLIKKVAAAAFTADFANVREDAVNWLKDLKEHSVTEKEEKTEELQLRHPKITAKKIETKKGTRWLGRINKRDVCRARSEKAALKIARRISLEDVE